MSDNFTIHDYVYQQDDQRTPDDSNMPIQMFPEYAPLRFHAPWDTYHELEYYAPPDYPHPLMMCPPTANNFDDLVYPRREFPSSDDSFYLSTESSPTVGALVIQNDENYIGGDIHEPKSQHNCNITDNAEKQKEQESKKPSHNRSKDRKRCHNCNTAKSPSWRRSVSAPHKGSLLCNACGLYEKTSKSKRMLVSDEEGTLKVVRKRDKANYVCHHCGTKESTRWKKSQQRLYFIHNVFVLDDHIVFTFICDDTFTHLQASTRHY
ncbi:hypothetical protein K501DRAFT_272531 [Backusella circina FSU 941]|nr:hypothetical protein K501DRAFT_272531 [Backusella circina FSU 941]